LPRRCSSCSGYWCCSAPSGGSAPEIRVETRRSAALAGQGGCGRIGLQQFGSALRVAREAARMFVELPSRREKGVAQRHVHVLAPRMVGDDLAARHRDVDRYDEVFALLLVMMRPLHDDAASGHVGMELLELGSLLANRVLQG